MAPASPSTARALNDRLALKLLQEHGPLSAAQLKELTGLARPTVADLVQRLLDSGLIKAAGESEARRRGPNARLYALAADRAHLAALDMRVDSFRIVVADLLGSTLAEADVPVSVADRTDDASWSGDGTEAATAAAAERCAELLDRTVAEAGVDRLDAVVVGVPGLVEPATARLRASSGLGWHHALLNLLRDRLPAHVRTENEANLAALAELRRGAARDRDSFVLFWLGEGPGAAVILDGRLRAGASGGAGEIGFLPVPGTTGLPSAANCESGFHALASADAARGLAAEYGVEGAAGLAGDAGGAADPGSAAAALRAAVAAGDAGGSAAEFLDAYAARVAIGAAAVTAVLDPGCVVLGGELGHAGGPRLAAAVERHLATLTPLRTEVRSGEFGGTGVLHGALLAAQDAAEQLLFPAPE